MIYEKILNFNKNKIELNFNNQINYTFKIYKLLDFQTFIKNKLQFESYFLKKNYNFEIIFSGINFPYYF